MKIKHLIQTFIVALVVSSAILPINVKADENQEYTIDFKRMLSSPEGPGVISKTGAVQIPIRVTKDLLDESRVEYIESGTTAGNYTEEDLYILAHVICGEAQSYSDEEQRYVGSVVLNRVNSEKYPNTIKGVVFQKNQYACTWDGNYYRTPTERNWANAEYLLKHGSVFPPNVVYQSGSRQGKGVYLRTAQHYYCY